MRVAEWARKMSVVFPAWYAKASAAVWLVPCSRCGPVCLQGRLVPMIPCVKHREAAGDGCVPLAVLWLKARSSGSCPVVQPPHMQGQPLLGQAGCVRTTQPMAQAPQRSHGTPEPQQTDQFVWKLFFWFCFFVPQNPWWKFCSPLECTAGMGGCVGVSEWALLWWWVCRDSAGVLRRAGAILSILKDKTKGFP